MAPLPGFGGAVPCSCVPFAHPPLWLGEATWNGEPRALGSRRVSACPRGARRPGWLFLSDGALPPSLTVPPGAALLDLEQTTLPGIAHLVVETMIVSDQIRPEDRASVLRTLLLKHRCQGGAPGTGLLGQLLFQEHRLTCVAF